MKILNIIIFIFRKGLLIGESATLFPYQETFSKVNQNYFYL